MAAITATNEVTRVSKRRTNELFISYSRRNQDFVARMVAGFKVHAVDPWFDRDDIPKGAEWWREIQRGIVGANAFVFVITAHSLRSEVCNWELAYAIENSKKIIPVIHEDVFKDPALLEEIRARKTTDQDGKVVSFGENWDHLGHINFIFLSETDDLDNGIIEILDTARTDLDYLQEHTRLLQRAVEWNENHREKSYLLRGLEVTSAGQWLAQGFSKTPRPRDLHVEYIEASEKSQRQNQRVMITAISVAAVAISALFVMSVILGINADRERRLADDLRAEAELNEAKAQENLRRANESQSRFLADLSEQALEEGRPQRALLLALRSFDHFNPAQPEESLFTVDGYVALSNAMNSPIQQTLHLGHDDPVNGVVWNSSETRILSWSGDVRAGTGALRIWDAQTGELLLEIAHDDALRGAIWSADERRVLSWSGEAVTIWDAETGEESLSVAHQAEIQGAVWNSDETRVLSWSGNFTERFGEIYVWDAETGEVLLDIEQAQVVVEAMWNAREDRIFALTQPNLFREVFTQQVWDASNGKLLLDIANLSVLDLDPNGRFLAARVSATNKAESVEGVQIFNTDTGEEVVLLPHEEQIGGILWDNDGIRVATWPETPAENIYTVRIWDANQGQVTMELPHGREIDNVVWNNDGSQVLTWTYDQNNNVSEVRVWRLDSGREVVNQSYDGLVQKATWNATESRIFIWLGEKEDGGGLKVLDTETRRLELELAYADDANELIWNGAEDRFLGAFSDGTVRMWRVGTTQGQFDLISRAGRVVDGQLSANGELLLANAVDFNENRHTVMIWDLLEERVALEIPHVFQVNRLFWSSDEARILTVSGDGGQGGMVQVWDARNGENLLTIPNMGEVLDARWYQDDTRLLTLMTDGTFREWDTETGEEIVPASVDEVTWDSVIHAPSGQRFIWETAPDENGVVVEIQNGSGESITTTHDEEIISGLWSADGAQIVTWSQAFAESKGGVQIWDAATGERLLQLEHNQPVGGVIWNANETRILSWTDDIHVWDVATGEEILRLPHTDDVIDARWNADGNFIYALSDSRLWVWFADIPALLEQAQAATVRELTETELTEAYLTDIDPTPAAEIAAEGTTIP